MKGITFNWSSNSLLPSNMNVCRFGSIIIFRRFKNNNFYYGFTQDGKIWFTSESQIIKFLTL